MKIEDIGTRIRTLRKRKGITQAQIGDLLGISSVYAGRLERKGAKLTLEQIAKIATALEVPLDFLLTGKQNKDEDQAAAAKHFKKRYFELMLIFLQSAIEMNADYLSTLLDKKKSNYPRMATSDELNYIGLSLSLLNIFLEFNRSFDRRGLLNEMLNFFSNACNLEISYLPEKDLYTMKVMIKPEYEI